MTQDLVCNSILSLHLGRGVVSSVKMVSLRHNGMSSQKGKVHLGQNVKQLRPRPWVRGQWQWCYGSNMSIIIIIIIIALKLE